MIIFIILIITVIIVMMLTLCWTSSARFNLLIHCLSSPKQQYKTGIPIIIGRVHCFSSPSSSFSHSGNLGGPSKDVDWIDLSVWDESKCWVVKQSPGLDTTVLWVYPIVFTTLWKAALGWFHCSVLLLYIVQLRTKAIHRGLWETWMLPRWCMTILGSANHQTKVQERKSLYTAQTEGKETVMISVDLLLLLLITLLITPRSSNTPQPPYHRVPM